MSIKNSGNISLIMLTSEKTSLSFVVQSPTVRICTLRYSSPGAEVIENGCLVIYIIFAKSQEQYVYRVKNKEIQPNTGKHETKCTWTLLR